MESSTARTLGRERRWIARVARGAFSRARSCALVQQAVEIRRPVRGNMSGRVLALMLLIAVTGCTNPPPYNPAPPGVLVKPPAVPAGTSAGRVMVFRDGSFTGSLNYRWVTLNKSVVANLLPLQRTEFDLQPGSYQLGVHCYAYGKWKEKVIGVVVRSGETQSFLLSAKLTRCAVMDPLADSEVAHWRDRTKFIEPGPT
jgi:hypothetical protein